MAVAHVVVLPLPTRGHVNPMLHLAQLLARQANGKLLVTFVNSEINDRVVTAEQRADLLALGIRLETLPDGLPDDADRTTQVLELCRTVFIAMPAPFEALLARLQPPPSCIIADTWLTFADSVAEKLGIPFANFWTQSAASFFSLFIIGNGLYKGRPEGEPVIPGATYLRESDMNSFARCYDPSDFMFRFVTAGFDRVSHFRWNFINTFDELEHDTLLALGELHGLQVQPIGPLLPRSLVSGGKAAEDEGVVSLWPREESCLSWLDGFEPRSVLYVAFGSLALLSSKQIEEIARGLEESGHPFLWVTRPNLIYGDSPSFNEDFLERVKGRAFFVSWAPQLRVLHHPAVGAFFTHGGWNSTLEAIAAGMPMLGWPYFSDQPMDCTCIEQGWRVGLKLRDGLMDEGIVPRQVVAQKVQTVMRSDRFRDAALPLSKSAKAAAQPGGSSYSNFQNFVNTLTQKTTENGIQ